MKPRLLNVLVYLLISLSLLGMSPAQAKPAKSKVAQAADEPVKERLVLMPLRVGKEIQDMRGQMETALVEGLAQKYRVYSGDEVELKTKEIYSQETQRANSAKKDCDETRCLQDIAIAFKAEYIAIANVSKIEGGYLLALNIRSMSDNKDVGSKSLPCKGCDAFQVIDKLKELSGATAAPAATPVSVVALSAAPESAVSGNPEAALWAEAQKGNSIEDYEVYLGSYPKGKFVPLAKARIKKLKETVPLAALPEPAQVSNVVASAAEISLWDGVRSTNRADDYETYLAQYPQGKFAVLARSLIKKLYDAVDTEAWQTANKTAAETDYRNYLNKYPQGKYAELARVKINNITEAAENEAWQAAGNSASEAGYQRYLAIYPQGRYAEPAQAKITQLKAEQAAREEAALWQQANAGEDSALVQSYLDKYPGGLHVADAMAKIKAIEAARLKAKQDAELKARQDAEERALNLIAVNMVSIPGKKYEMGKYEVTQIQWRAVLGDNPSKFAGCDTCPVEQVSWNDIQTFLQKLNAKTGKQYRLPTEDEWKYACYGGEGGMFSSPNYCGGDVIDGVAWYGNNSKNTTHSVGKMKANGYGLYDMSGNVWEWTSACMEENCEQRVLRGGSWNDLPGYAHAADRLKYGVTVKDSRFGFRLVRTLRQ